MISFVTKVKPTGPGDLRLIKKEDERGGEDEGGEGEDEGGGEEGRGGEDEGGDEGNKIEDGDGHAGVIGEYD